jgi:nucleoside-diphosphate-sugar epimerase
MNQEGGPTELDIGKSLVDAASEAGVRHFVYSGMASASETTGGAVPNKAFDSMLSSLPLHISKLIQCSEACCWRTCKAQGV